MNKVEYLFGFGTEGVEKVFADALFAVIVLAIVAFALGKRMAAAKARKGQPQPTLAEPEVAFPAFVDCTGLDSDTDWMALMVG